MRKRDRNNEGRREGGKDGRIFSLDSLLHLRCACSIYGGHSCVGHLYGAQSLQSSKINLTRLFQY